jgi:hypothetical protein
MFQISINFEKYKKKDEISRIFNFIFNFILFLFHFYFIFDFIFILFQNTLLNDIISFYK